jgi:hypothetical protein
MKGWKDTHVGPLLPERAPSEGPRLGEWHVSACQWVGGWKSCAQWKINQSPSLEITIKLGGSMYIVRRVQSRIDQATLEMKLRIKMMLVEKG